MNSITAILKLEDSDIFISDIIIQDTTKFLSLETNLFTHHRPACGFKIHSSLYLEMMKSTFLCQIH